MDKQTYVRVTGAARLKWIGVVNIACVEVIAEPIPGWAMPFDLAECRSRYEAVVHSRLYFESARSNGRIGELESDGRSGLRGNTGRHRPLTDGPVQRAYDDVAARVLQNIAEQVDRAGG